MESLVSWISSFPLLASERSIKILNSLSIVVFCWLLYLLVNQIIRHQSDDLSVRYRLRQASGYIASTFAILLCGRLWLKGLEPLLTFMGIISAAFTITQKETLMNLVGWAFISWKTLFELGDRIQIGDNRGDVIGIGLFYFTLMEVEKVSPSGQSTGRMVKVPNAQIITTPVANYTRTFPLIWHEIPVVLSMDSNWQKAESILHGISKHYSQKLTPEVQKELKKAADTVILFKHWTPAVYFSLQPGTSKVVLTIRLLCNPRQIRDIESSIWKSILTEFSETEDVKLGSTLI